MIDKNIYLEKINNASNILKKYPASESLFNEALKIKKNIDNWNFRIVLIGGFSAGKSAFLNKLLEKNLLKEAQGPQTSLATEINWAPVEFAEAVINDGTVKKISIDEAVSNPPENSDFIILHLSSKFFKDRPEIIIVDFPGLDSNFESHDKAIANYIERASAFILFVPASNGALQESERRFIHEAARYPQGLACFISKSDLVPVEQAQDVANYVKKQISDIYDADIPVEIISAKEDSSEIFTEKAAEIVDAFQPQELFNFAFTLPINVIIRKGLAVISSMIEASKLDTENIEAKINECERKRNNLQKQLERESKELNRKYQREIIPGVVERVNSALNNSMSSLIDAAISGQNRFSSVVQGIIRPILSDVPEKISASLRTLTNNIILSVPDDDKNYNDEKLRQIILDATEIITAPLIAKTEETQPRKKGSGVGTSMAAVAATSIHPVLGVVVALAPVAVELISAFRANNGRVNQREQIRQQLEEKVIPDIVRQFEDDITPAMFEARDEMLEKIKKSISEAILIEEKTLQDAKNKIDEQRKNYEDKISELSRDFEALEALLIKEA